MSTHGVLTYRLTTGREGSKEGKGVRKGSGRDVLASLVVLRGQEISEVEVDLPASTTR